ncbi:MAG: type II toxin-antitoxin system HipA family toxin [Gammaproteobacteria bacterium]|nr:type II toxin-antitoxin system HipA family toxin [Gammaproteobacteria bacterium]
MNGECFVYIVLPGETGFTTAGRFVLSADRQGLPTGRFVYGRSYLARPEAVPIDPIELGLTTEIFETRRLHGVFGALRDAGPDYWGRLVIERHSGATALGELDYLMYSPEDRAGALSFGLHRAPPAPRRAFSRTLDLAELQRLADAIIGDKELPLDHDSEHVKQLLLAGTSMGGARPKAVVLDGDDLWIAKFNRPDDRWNHARVEHAMLVLARECGLETAESRVETVGDRDALLVRRFDRARAEVGFRRARYLSALTLLRAEDTHHDRAKWSYVLLAEELRRVSARPQQDAGELFRRMCFNALISNTDDHPRNHAVIAMDTDWRLSPAYDLTPSTPVSNERRDLALVCGDLGRYAHVDNLLSQHSRFLIDHAAAEATVRVMEQTVRNRWYAIARAQGVTERDCERTSRAFAYPGFRLLLPKRA